MLEIKSTSDFYKILQQASGLVVVKFGSEWCGPCRALQPKLDGLSRSYNPTQVLFTTIDATKNPKLSNQFDITTIPAIHYFLKGKHLRTSESDIVSIKRTIESILSKYRPPSKKNGIVEYNATSF